MGVVVVVVGSYFVVVVIVVVFAILVVVCVVVCCFHVGDGGCCVDYVDVVIAVVDAGVHRYFVLLFMLSVLLLFRVDAVVTIAVCTCRY